MKYSVALKVIRINNVFNNEHTKELIYEAVDKYGQTYEFKSEARIPMNNYIACEFNKYTVVLLMFSVGNVSTGCILNLGI